MKNLNNYRKLIKLSKTLDSYNPEIEITNFLLLIESSHLYQAKKKEDNYIMIYE